MEIRQAGIALQWHILDVSNSLHNAHAIKLPWKKIYIYREREKSEDVCIYGSVRVEAHLHFYTIPFIFDPPRHKMRSCAVCLDPSLNIPLVMLRTIQYIVRT
jgi:hypothetical protein